MAVMKFQLKMLYNSYTQIYQNISSNRDERPPQSSSPSATPGNNGQRWVPPSHLKRTTQSQDERNDLTFRKVRGILNKLTPEKFDKLGLELLNVGIDSQLVLRGIILLIFEKALDEPKYSSLYAQLCHRLCEDTPNFEPNTSSSKTFKRLLLTKCQDEFENRAKATDAYEKDGPLSADEEEQFALAKGKMLGNIKFIGELGKLDMVHESIMHQCIRQLLAKKKRGTVADMAEDLECLCQIMKTVGKRLDHDKARSWMDQYFSRMQSYRLKSELPSRIRFMIQDVAELRENDWVPRKILRDSAPRTIQQVHHEAARDMGQSLPGHQHNMPIMPGFQPNVDLFGKPMNGFNGHRPPMSDMFGPVPTSPPVMGGIGTGPGVIPMDHPFGQNYRGRGRGYNRGQYNKGQGGGDQKYNKYENKDNTDRNKMRNHNFDDSSDEENDRPSSGGSGGGSGRGGYYNNRGGYYNNRGGRGGYNNHQHQGQNNYNRNYQNQNPNYQPHGEDGGGGFVPRGGGRGNYDNRGRGGYYDRGRGRGHSHSGQYNNNDGGYNAGYQPYNQGGYQSSNYQSNSYQSNNYQSNSYQSNNYQSNRGGFHGGQQNNQQMTQKDIDKLPPRFRKQLEMQNKAQQQEVNGGSPPSGSSNLQQPQTNSGPPSPNMSGPPPPGPQMHGSAGPPQQPMGNQQQPFFPFQNGPPMNNPPHRMGSPIERGSSPHGGSTDSPPPPPQHMLGPPQSYQRSPSKPEEISLRPVRMQALRPNIPNMLPKSAQGAPPPVRNVSPQFEDLITNAPTKVNTMGPPATNLTIKTVPAPEKNKVKKTSLSQEELKQATDKMLKEFLEQGYDIEVAVKAVKDMKPPKRYIAELVTFLVLRSLDQSDTDRENVGKLIQALKQDGVVESQNFMEGFTAVLDQMKSLEADVPLVKSYVSKFAAFAVTSEIIGLTDLAEPLENGRHYPLFLLCLQQIHKLKDKEWLVKVFNDSKLDLQKMLPECDQSQERMLEILDDRGLSFMFPLLHIQSDLWKQINADPNPAVVYKWIKENCSPTLFQDPKFIDIVFTNVLRYITTESTLTEGTDLELEPDKATVKKEKELMSKFKGMLASYIHTSIDLQVIAIYVVQVFCHGHKFPKGLLLRLFMYMYDMEVIDEEAFLKWKEDLNDDYPGKGKALFQVNQWLIWLEQAESESSDED